MKILFIAFFLFFNIFLFSQKNDYKEYYNYVYKAEEAIINNRYSIALESYDSAFNSVDYVFVKELINSAILATILQNDSLFKRSISQSFCQGWKIEYFQNNNILYDYNKPLVKELELKYDSCRNIYINSFRIDLIEELELMYSRDQKYRKSRFLFKRQKKQLDKIRENDSLNVLNFYQIISDYGFPSEKITGFYKYTSNPVDIVLHHNPDYKISDSLLLKYVYSGDYSPYSYAKRYDYHKTNYTLNIEKGKELVTVAYYTVNYMNINDKQLIEKINKYRTDILLPTIEFEKKKQKYKKRNNNYRFIL